MATVQPRRDEHRPAVWALPKGLIDSGERGAETAVREVLEETGLRCRLRDELDSVHYTDSKGRPKIVRYWLMDVAEDQGFEPNDEVDEVRWLELPAAAALMTYAHDQELVASLVSGRPSA